MEPYRTVEGQCEICGTTVAEVELTDVFGVKFCAPCAAGDRDDALARRGFSRMLARFSRSTNLTEFLAVTVEREARLAIELKLLRETFGSKLMDKLGRGDLKVGDAAFDDFVKIVVTDEHRPVAEMLLADEGIRTAVLALLKRGRDGAAVELANGLVSSTICWKDMDEEPDAAVCARDTLALAWLIAKAESRLISRGFVVR